MQIPPPVAYRPQPLPQRRATPVPSGFGVAPSPGEPAHNPFETVGIWRWIPKRWHGRVEEWLKPFSTKSSDPLDIIAAHELGHALTRYLTDNQDVFIRLPRYTLLAAHGFLTPNARVKRQEQHAFKNPSLEFVYRALLFSTAGLAYEDAYTTLLLNKVKTPVASFTDPTQLKAAIVDYAYCAVLISELHKKKSDIIFPAPDPITAKQLKQYFIIGSQTKLLRSSLRSGGKNPFQSSYQRQLKELRAEKAQFEKKVCEAANHPLIERARLTNERIISEMDPNVLKGMAKEIAECRYVTPERFKVLVNAWLTSTEQNRVRSHINHFLQREPRL